MRKFSSLEEVKAAGLPPWQHSVLYEAESVMEKIFCKAFDHERGFVVLIEEIDTPEDAIPLLGYPMGSKLETTWRRHGCLIDLTLWGNSGDGVTWVCPEIKGYAPKCRKFC